MAVERTLILADPDAVARGPSFVDVITSSPTLAFVLEGEGAIATNLADADRGLLRGSCALAMPNNLVRGSDSQESAEHEVEVWFADVLV